MPVGTRLVVDLQDVVGNLVTDSGERFDKTAQLFVAERRRLGAIGLHMGDRDAADARRQRQRVVARRDNDVIAAQRYGRGKKRDAGVAGVEKAQVVVTVPGPQHDGREIDPDAGTGRRHAIAGKPKGQRHHEHRAAREHRDGPKRSAAASRARFRSRHCQSISRNSDAVPQDLYDARFRSYRQEEPTIDLTVDLTAAGRLSKQGEPLR
jgi:hypothetical protein